MNNGRVVVSNDYLEAANNVYPMHSKKNIQIYVEGDPDVRFWAPLFNKYKDRFNINISRAYEAPANDGKAANGCSRIASLVNSGDLVLGKSLLVCVDSDYRYILNEYAGGYEFVPNNKYVLETIVCAKENVISAPDGLKELIQKSVSLTTWFPHLDLESLFCSLSRALFVLQSLHLFYIKNKSERAKVINQKIISELEKFQGEVRKIDYIGFGQKHFLSLIRNLRKEFLIFFKQHLDSSDREVFCKFLKEIHDRMEGYDNALYFIRGHDFYDYILKDLMGRCSYLLLEHEKQRRLALNDAEGVSQLYNEKINPLHLVQCRDDYVKCKHFSLCIRKIDEMFAA